MKTPKALVPLATVALLVGITGCEKKETTVPDQGTPATSGVGDAVKQATDTVKETGAKTVSEVAEKAKEVAAPANAKAQELIDAARKLVSEGKLQDAQAKLKELSGEKLTAEQQSVVNGLKAQIEKALGAASKTATDAAGAAGGLLPKR